MNSPCFECGAVATERRAEYDFSHGGRHLRIDDRHMHCADCDSVFYAGDQISEHERTVSDAIRRSEGLLTSDELRNIRLKYQLTQTDMEALLSTGPKTWTRWERGKVAHSKATDSLLRVFASQPFVAKCMLVAAGVQNPRALEELDRAEEAAQRAAHREVQERLGQLDEQQGTLVQRATEMALLVSREGLRNSLRADAQRKEVAA